MSDPLVARPRQPHAGRANRVSEPPAPRTVAFTAGDRRLRGLAWEAAVIAAVKEECMPSEPRPPVGFARLRSGSPDSRRTRRQFR
jgi:hypothetical protein